MQSARSLIDLAVEFSAGMQGGHDDFQRRLVLELGVRDRSACHDHVCRTTRILPALSSSSIRVAWRHRFVMELSMISARQWLQGIDVGAADYTLPGAAAHRFQPSSTSMSLAV